MLCRRHRKHPSRLAMLSWEAIDSSHAHSIILSRDLDRSRPKLNELNIESIK